MANGLFDPQQVGALTAAIDEGLDAVTVQKLAGLPKVREITTSLSSLPAPLALKPGSQSAGRPSWHGAQRPQFGTNTRIT